MPEPTFITEIDDTVLFAVAFIPAHHTIATRNLSSTKSNPSTSTSYKIRKKNPGLNVRIDRTKCNPQHVNVLDWPADKPLQKNRAQLVAKDSAFKPSIQISDTRAAEHVGKFAIVEGVVSQIVTTPKSNVVFNFASMHPNQAFTAWIQSGSAFVSDALLYGLLGKTVRVIGKIEIFNGKPEMRIVARWQIAAT